MENNKKREKIQAFVEEGVNPRREGEQDPARQVEAAPEVEPGAAAENQEPGAAEEEKKPEHDFPKHSEQSKQFEKEILTLKAALRASEGRIASLTAEVEERTAQLLTEERSRAQHVVQQMLEDQATLFGVEIQRERKKHEALKERYEALTVSHDFLKDMGAKRLGDADAEKASLKEEIQLLQNSLNREQARIAAMKRDLDRVMAEKAKLDAYLTRTQETNKQFEKELKNQGEKAGKAEKIAEKLGRQIAEQKRKIEALEYIRDNQGDAITSLEKQIALLSAPPSAAPAAAQYDAGKDGLIKKLKKQIDSLKGESLKKDAEADAVAAEKKVLRERIHHLEMLAFGMMILTVLSFTSMMLETMYEESQDNQESASSLALAAGNASLATSAAVSRAFNESNIAFVSLLYQAVQSMWNALTSTPLSFYPSALPAPPALVHVRGEESVEVASNKASPTLENRSNKWEELMGKMIQQPKIARAIEGAALEILEMQKMAQRSKGTLARLIQQADLILDSPSLKSAELLSAHILRTETYFFIAASTFKRSKPEEIIQHFRPVIENYKQTLKVVIGEKDKTLPTFAVMMALASSIQKYVPYYDAELAALLEQYTREVHQQLSGIRIDHEAPSTSLPEGETFSETRQSSLRFFSSPQDAIGANDANNEEASNSYAAGVPS
jgi:hypothetical protein